MRQMRRPGIITGVNAESCYDRIVHAIAILIARNEGLTLFLIGSFWSYTTNKIFCKNRLWGVGIFLRRKENNTIPRYVSRKWSKSDILANHYNYYGLGDAQERPCA